MIAAHHFVESLTEKLKASRSICFAVTQAHCGSKTNYTPMKTLLAAKRNLLLVFTLTALLITVRAEAMDFPVTAPGDNGAKGTLRSQINAALIAGPGNSVSFSIPFTSIGLTMGELVINKDLTIQGPGAMHMLIFNNSGRVFHITGGANVSITGLTLTGTIVGANGANGTILNPFGQPGQSTNGAGIFSENPSLLTLGQCVMSNCTATGGKGGDAYTNELSLSNPATGGNGGSASGGALASDGDCFLVGCTFVNNFSRGGMGGKGHDSGSGGLGGEADGGAVQVEYDSSALSVINCTFNGNVAIGGAGGLGGDAFVRSMNPTVGGPGGNGGPALGGAVYVITGCPDATCDGVLHCTISGNECAPGFGGLGGAGADGAANGLTGMGGVPYGCGLCYNNTVMKFLPVGNSIIGGNFSSSGFTPVGPDVGGTPFSIPAMITSNDHNLIGLLDGSEGWTNHDLRGSIAAGAINPLLGPLQINAGQTPTMAPLACSPAIDAGMAEGQPVDQAGQNRTVPLIIVFNGSDGTDIGAYELQAFPQVTLNQVQANGNYILSWPAPDDSCFILQETASLVPPVQWMDANNQVNVVGNQNQVVIPLPMNGNLFFRLRHP